MMASTSSQGWILRTTDGGNTWVIDTTIGKQLYSMHFYAPGKGIVVGKDSATAGFSQGDIKLNLTPPTFRAVFTFIL